MTAVRLVRKRDAHEQDGAVRRGWYVIGPPFGAVQYVERDYGDTMPARLRAWHPDGRMAVDLGFHATKDPGWAMEMDCDVIEGKCFYDGSGLNAERVKVVFDQGGEEALWAYLDDYFAEVFDLPYAVTSQEVDA